MEKSSNISALNGLGIFLVVLGHSAGVLPDKKKSLMEIDPLYAIFIHMIDLIYVFHMPLFFFISGVLYYYSSSNFSIGFMAFCRKKALRLLLPYVVISSITYPIKVLLSTFALRPLEWGLLDFSRNIVIPWENTIVFFWFLPTLFLMMIGAKLLFRRNSSPLYDAVMLGTAALFFFVFEHENRSGLESVMNIGGMLHNFIYFALGAIACKYRPALVTLDPPLHLVAPFVLLSAGYFLYPALQSQPAYIPIMAVAGIAGSMVVASRMKAPWAWLGAYSYQIYLLSWFPQIFVRILFGQLFFINIWLSVVLSLLLGLFVPIALIGLLARFKIKGVPQQVLQY